MTLVNKQTGSDTQNITFSMWISCGWVSVAICSPCARYVHLGGDEAQQFRDAAYNGPEGKKLKAELGIKTNGQLQVWIVAWLNPAYDNMR